MTDPALLCPVCRNVRWKIRRSSDGIFYVACRFHPDVCQYVAQIRPEAQPLAMRIIELEAQTAELESQFGGVAVPALREG